MYSDESPGPRQVRQSEAQQGHEPIQAQGGPEDRQALRKCDGLGLL